MQTVESLQDVLRTQAYSLDAAPGHSLARLADFASTQPIVGHDEQYSALMTLVLRSAGIPSRVVVGFVPDSEEVEGLAAGESVDVMADDVEAWVEVPFDGVGWVAFDPVLRDNEVDIGGSAGDVGSSGLGGGAIDTAAGATDGAQTNTASEQPVEEPPEDDVDEASDGAFDFGSIALALLLALLVVLGLLMVFATVVVLLKARRRRMRRNAQSPAAQIYGAYSEYFDRKIDDGVLLPTEATARQVLGGLPAELEHIPSQSRGLLVLVEEAGFASEVPGMNEADAAWQHSDALIDGIRSAMPLRQNVAAAVSIRSLRRGRKN